MDSGAFRVGAVRGIEIRIDPSWLLIAFLVAWTYWNRFNSRPAHAGVEAFVMAIAGAALFFTSILLHELAHALEARRRGVHVGSITLFLFGGVTETKFDVRRPVDEFALTAVGPLTSFALAALLGLAAFAADAIDWRAAAVVMGLVAWINLALGAFNLLPGAPLDGGRILRAGVWWITGDRRRSIKVAGHAGQILGALILALGLAQVFFVPAAFSGGLWLALIGWFLLRAAGAEVAQAELRDALAGLTARSLVDRRAPVSARDSVAEAIDRFRDEDVDVLAVEDAGTTVGVLGVEDVRRVTREGDLSVRVGDAMQQITAMPTVDVDEHAAEVIEHLVDQGVVAVKDGGRVIGIMTAPRVATVVRRARQFDGRAK